MMTETFRSVAKSLGLTLDGVTKALYVNAVVRDICGFTNVSA